MDQVIASELELAKKSYRITLEGLAFMEKGKIKILLVVEAMLGGVRQHVLDIVCGLDARKYEIYLAYSEYRADIKFFKAYESLKNKVHLICCEYMVRELSLSMDWKAIKELVKMIKEIKPDIVHCHSSKAGIVGRPAAFFGKVKKVFYTPHAYAFQNPELSRMKRRIYILAEKFLARYMTTRTVNVSQGEMDMALKYHIDKKDKFVLIYNGIEKTALLDKVAIREQNGFQQEKKYIGVTARLSEQKDPFTFLEIAKRVIEQESNAEFLYIGAGPMEQSVRNWIKKEHLEDKIHLLGYRDNAAALVAMFDIYLSTSLFEGLPYSVIEAIRAGIPVVATDVVGNQELIVDGVSGMLFPLKDAQKGAELVLEQLHTNKIQSEKIIQIYEERFSLEAMLKKLDCLFQNGG